MVFGSCRVILFTVRRYREQITGDAAAVIRFSSDCLSHEVSSTKLHCLESRMEHTRGRPRRAATKVGTGGPYVMVGIRSRVFFRRARSTAPLRRWAHCALFLPCPRRSHGLPGGSRDLDDMLHLLRRCGLLHRMGNRERTQAQTVLTEKASVGTPI